MAENPLLANRIVELDRALNSANHKNQILAEQLGRLGSQNHALRVGLQTIAQMTPATAELPDAVRMANDVLNANNV